MKICLVPTSLYAITVTATAVQDLAFTNTDVYIYFLNYSFTQGTSIHVLMSGLWLHCGQISEISFAKVRFTHWLLGKNTSLFCVPSIAAARLLLCRRGC